MNNNSASLLIAAFMVASVGAGIVLDRFALLPADQKREMTLQQKGEQRKADDVQMFKENGFDLVGVMRQGAPTGSAVNCYTLKKMPDRGLTYKGCITHWDFGGGPEISELAAIEKIAAPGAP